MNMGVGPLVLSLSSVGLAGCGGSYASPEATCPPGIAQGQGTFRFVEPQPADVAPADPVNGANYLGCDDGNGLSGDEPVEAWRAKGLGPEYLVTMTACARYEGTSAAADCDPNAPRYVLWKVETATP